MPDSLDSDAPESNLGGNTAGGDGIVTEEQVQKGYVWMNDVNKNIFDTTYEEVVAYFGVEGEFVKEEYYREINPGFCRDKYSDGYAGACCLRTEQQSGRVSISGNRSPV